MGPLSSSYSGSAMQTVTLIQASSSLSTIQSSHIQPSKIICIGRNYVEHAQELGNAVPTEPVVFIKPNSAISATLSAGDDEVNHYEGEICFLVQNNQLAAVGFGLDLTKRETQSRLKQAGLPWERAKAFNGAAVFSEFVPIEASMLDQLSLELEIDGECRQQGGVELMLFKPAFILEDVSSFLSLEDGDIIMTGTPKGVGEVKVGSSFTGRVFAGDELLVQQSWVAQ